MRFNSNCFVRKNFPNYFRNPRSCWSHIGPINISNPKENGRKFADDNLNAFPLMKCVVFCFKFHLTLLPSIHLLRNHHWFIKWFGAEQTTIHYFNKLRHIFVSVIFDEISAPRVTYIYRTMWNLYWEAWENVPVSISGMCEIALESEILQCLCIFKPVTMTIIFATVSAEALPAPNELRRVVIDNSKIRNKYRIPSI